MTGPLALARLRLLGLAGTTLLAIGGYLAGATPGPAPASQAEALWGSGAGFRIGLAGYVAGLVLLGWAWWRIGDRLRAGSGGGGGRADESPRLRWLLVTGALWALPLLVAPPLASRDIYAYACQGAGWLDGHDPYAAGAATSGCPWLESVPGLWHDTTAPYGPVALLGSAAAVALARALAAGEAGQLLVAIGGLRLVAVAGVLLAAGFAPRLARAVRVDPAIAGWLGLVTPLVAVHAVAGGHNDALVAGLLLAGLALARSRGTAGWGAAGLALGLAVAVKVTALAALPFALLLAAYPRDRAGYRAAAVVAGAAAAGFAAATLVTGLGTGWTRALSDTGALGQWSSVPTGLGMAAGYALRAAGAPEAYDPAVSVAQALGLAGLVVVGAALLLRAWRRRDDPRGVVVALGATLAAVLVLGPVVYPWYALAPLAVLAASVQDWRVRRGLALATLVLTGLVLPSGLGVPVLTKLPGALLVVVLVVVVGWRWWWQRSRRSRAAAAPPPGPRTPAR